MNRAKENPIKLIRWSGPVLLPSGKQAYMLSRSGNLEDVKRYAEEIAKKSGVTVAAVL